ncbi:MAG: tetratricopeptide repeat protein [Candidatus Sumerlaeia bacterium]
MKHRRSHLLILLIAFLLACVVPAVSGQNKAPERENAAAKKQAARQNNNPRNAWKEYRDHIAAGNRLIRQKKYQKARQEFQQAMELAPKQVAPLIQIASSYLREKDVDKAREYALKAWELDPKRPSYNIMRQVIDQDIRENRFEIAIRNLQKLQEVFQDDFWLLQSMVQCYGQTKEYEKGIEIGEELIDLTLKYYEENPDSPVFPRQYITYLADIYANCGLLSQKLEELRKKLKGHPEESIESVTLARFLWIGAQHKATQELYSKALELMEEAIELRPKDAQLHREYSRQLQNLYGLMQGIEYLESVLAKVDNEDVILQELGMLYFNHQHFEKAEEVYLKLYAKNPSNNWLLRKSVDLILERFKGGNAEERFAEASAYVKKLELPEENQTALLKNIHKHFEDRLNLAQKRRERLAALERNLITSPTSALVFQELGEFHLEENEADLALSAWLKGAYLGNDGSHLITNAQKLIKGNDVNPRPFVMAALEHFPTDPDIFELLDTYIEARRRSRDRRFAMDPNLAEAFEVAAETCSRILEAENISDEMRLKARLSYLRYKNEPLHNDLELWMEVRKKTVALLDDPAITPELRLEILKFLAEIDADHLDKPEAAYESFRRLAEETGEKEMIKRMAEEALRIRPLPDPELLESFIEKEKIDFFDNDLYVLLSIWYWDMGKREEAVSLIEQSANDFPGRRGEAFKRRLTFHVRRRRPELALLLESSQADQEALDSIELIHEKRIRSSDDIFEADEPALRYETTRLRLPEALSQSRVQMNISRRPRVIEPPIAVSMSGENTQWQGNFFPIQIAPEREGEPAEVTLKMDCREVLPDKLVLRRKYEPLEELARRDWVVSAFYTYIEYSEPYELEFKYDRRLGYPIEVKPEGAKTSNPDQTISYSMVTPSDQTGTTFTLVFRHRQPWFQNRNQDLVEHPAVEITSIVRKKSTTLKRSGEEWILADEEREMSFRITPDSNQATNALKRSQEAEIVERRVYYFDSGARRW